MGPHAHRRHGEAAQEPPVAQPHGRATDAAAPGGVAGLLFRLQSGGNAAVARLVDGPRSDEPRSDGPRSDEPRSGLAEAIGARLGQGSAIPGPVRGELESALGQGLGGVGLHRDGFSAGAAEQLSARAFTVGQDIFFGAGQGDLGSPQGRFVLAHEAAHTTQAPAGPALLPDEGLVVSDPGDRHEVEAQRFAGRFMQLGAAAQPDGGALTGAGGGGPVGAGGHGHDGVHVWRDSTETSAPPEADIPTVDLEPNAMESAAEEEGFDETAQAEAEAEQPSVWHEIGEGAAGLAYGTMQSLTPGGFAAPSPAPHSRTFEFFRGAGQIATGITEMVAGGGGEVAGVALDATGAGAVLGVPLNVASALVIAQGAVSSAAGVQTIAHAMTMGGGSGGGPRLPAKGTPERAAVENARRSGIRGAQRRELENIQNGGRGTPGNQVWTDQELAQIRKTGKFPSDTRWHHSPTVANRPDLAGDASVVKPIRGGVKGHLAAHGGDFRK